MIDALGVVAGQALLGDDVGLNVDELQGEADLGTALEGGDRHGTLGKMRKVVLIDVDPHMQALAVAQHDHRLFPGHGGELSEPDVELKDLAIHRGPDGEPLEIDLECCRPGSGRAGRRPWRSRCLPSSFPPGCARGRPWPWHRSPWRHSRQSGPCRNHWRRSSASETAVRCGPARPRRRPFWPWPLPRPPASAECLRGAAATISL